MVLLRPSSVPDLVKDPNSLVRAGITGGDILWNAGMKDQGTTLSTIESNSTLFVGVTSRLREQASLEQRNPTIDDLSGKTLVTKFPTIAEEVFQGQVQVIPMPGSTEALQYVYPDCVGILDVTASGATIEANDITIVERLMDPVDVRMIEEAGLSSWQERIIADFTQALV